MLLKVFPLIVISPSEGSIAPLHVLIRVDLPAPFSPIRACISLLPVAKRMTEEENSEAILQRTRLLKAAREGDEEAIENLTLEDMDTYSMISRRIADEDVFSIVSTYFMPYGVECDHYNVLGEILNIEMVENSLTRERVYILTIESHDLIFEVCINQKDLLGEPAVGRRFKGIVWLQGNVSFQN